jgi:quinol-cytochrome oxidoreductase complex cytochrome b subunit
MRTIKQSLGFIYDTTISYPAPANLNYNYNFGVYALTILALQIISGIFLVMFYCSNASMAFLSVEHIMRDIPYGWFIRYVHANGASFFFIVVYLHLFRGLIYGSYFYPRRMLWCSGVIILLLMIITSFLGYVLPWGQMSYWAATVITNLASTVPFFGQKIVYWLWSGFSVENPTLTKFFSLHYLLPFVILALVLLHLGLLHQTGSSNPLGVKAHTDQIPFHPYYTIKDFFSILLFISFLIFFVSFIPNSLGHPDNYIPANPDLTPEHIVPEWYFLPFYAILRSIPNKLLGVVALLLSIAFLLILPFLDHPLVRSSLYKPLIGFLNILFIGNCLVLGYIGQSPLEEPYLFLGTLTTSLYFIYFLSLFLVGRLAKLTRIFPNNTFYSRANYSKSKLYHPLRHFIRTYTTRVHSKHSDSVRRKFPYFIGPLEKIYYSFQYTHRDLLNDFIVDSRRNLVNVKNYPSFFYEFTLDSIVKYFVFFHGIIDPTKGARSNVQRFNKDPKVISGLKKIKPQLSKPPPLL